MNDESSVEQGMAYTVVWSRLHKHYQVVKPKDGSGDGIPRTEKVEDTKITLWKPRDDGGDWLIEKTLFELPNTSSLSAMLIADERNTAQQVTALGLPSMRIVTEGPPPVGGRNANILWSVYAGASLEEVFGHNLTADEYLAAVVAPLRPIERFAQAGVLLLDGKPRNWVLPLSEKIAGTLDFGAATAIDHAHTVLASGACKIRTPFIGMRPNDAPEISRLLVKDSEVDLRSYLPGCPSSSAKHLRNRMVMGQISQSEYAYWMTRLRSHHFGPALQAGDIDLFRAMQSIYGAGWLQLLHDPNKLPSKRLHPAAVAFLQRIRPELEKMSATDPQDRHPNADALIDALTHGRLPQRSATVVVLNAQQYAEVGGAQPDTDPDDVVNTAPGWHGFNAASEEPYAMDAPMTPSWAERLKLLQAMTVAQRVGLAAQAGVAAVVLGVATLNAVVFEPTPATLQQARELQQVEVLSRTLQRTMSVADQQHVLQELGALRRSPHEDVRDAVDEALEDRYSRAMAGLLLTRDGRLLRRHADAAEAARQDRAVAEITLLGRLGFDKAKVWTQATR